MLNVYCKSVKDEYGKRGPEGPYQFEGDGAPMLVVKRWDGTELYNNVGWVTDEKAGVDRIKGVAGDALSKNGDVVPVDAKSVAKLLTKYDAGVEMAGDKPGKAYEEFDEIVQDGADKKDWPDGPCHVHTAAAARMEAIVEAGNAAITEALKEEKDRKKKSALKGVKKAYKGVEEIEKKVQEQLEALD